MSAGLEIFEKEERLVVKLNGLLMTTADIGMYLHQVKTPLMVENWHIIKVGKLRLRFIFWLATFGVIRKKRVHIAEQHFTSNGNSSIIKEDK